MSFVIVSFSLFFSLLRVHFALASQRTARSYEIKFSAEFLRRWAILNAGKTEHDLTCPAKSLQLGSNRISVYFGVSDSVGG
jgi:plasmid maintenance system killer protein